MSNDTPLKEREPLPAPVTDTVGMVREVLIPYADVTHNTRAIEHPVRMAALAEDLIGTPDKPRSLHPIAIDALWFHDILEDAKDAIGGKNARDALRLYAQTLDPEQKIYFDTILGDLSYVEERAESYRIAVAEGEDELSLALSESSNKNRHLSPGVWLTEAKSMPVNEIQKVINEVNVESVLIKALELIDNLKNPSSKDVALFQDAYEARYFYVPTIKYLSYYHPRLESIATLLDSEAKLRCLEKAGEEQYIESARKTLDALDSDILINSLRTMLGRVATTVHIDEDGITNNHGMHELVMSEVGLMGLNGYENSMELLPGNHREKSVGSLAWKRYKDRDLPRPPVDIAGVTILAPDRDHIPSVLRPFIKLVQTGEGFNFIPGGSRDEFVAVNGSKSFIENVTKGIKTYYDGAIAVPPDQDQDQQSSADEAIATSGGLDAPEYTVAKVTLSHTVVIEGQWVVIPYEVQVQSRIDYKDSRIGKFAHGTYKTAASDVYENDPGEVGESIAQRIRHLGKGITNPRSRDRGEYAASVYKF